MRANFLSPMYRHREAQDTMQRAKGAQGMIASVVSETACHAPKLFSECIHALA